MTAKRTIYTGLKKYYFYYTKEQEKEIRRKCDIYDRWMEFGIDLYDKLAKSNNKEKYEYPIFASFYFEMLETLDGIIVLDRNHCINASFPLVRKLLELYLQISFLMSGDSDSKATAYEVYYIYKTNKGKEDSRDIYRNGPNYTEYCSLAKEAYLEEKPHFYEWYDMYESVHENKRTKISIKKLCEEIIKDKRIYEEAYNILSKQSHGYLSRNNIIYDANDDKNYLSQARRPEGFSQQFILCTYIFEHLFEKTLDHFYFGYKFDEFQDLCKRTASA